jgi:hypothetical protein
MRGSVDFRSPSSTMTTYIWANTSSMKRFPHEQGCPYSRVGRGALLSRIRILHSAHGRKIVGSEVRISFADFTQSISHTGHFIVLAFVLGH